MKKILTLAVLFIMVFSLNGCGSASNIPSLEEIKTQYYTDDEIEQALNRVKREELIKVWGKPDRTIDSEDEDLWILDDRRVLVISYNIFGRVDDADIEG